MTETIRTVHARQVLDSRGNPTVEVEVTTTKGFTGRAAVPSGASTGIYEAVELRDGGSRYHGKGVLKAVEAVKTEIAQRLRGVDVTAQREIDRLMAELDGTPNKSRLGGNAILGVSVACAKAAAECVGVKLYNYIDPEARLLPVPFFNVVNGGKHAGNQLDFQEFMVAPVGVDSFTEALRVGAEVYQTLKAKLLKDYGKNAINVGDEGGFSPPMSTPDEALEAIQASVEELGYGGETRLAMDVAASSFYKPDGYHYMGRVISRGELIDEYSELVSKFHVASLEDPLEEEDYEGFVEVTKALPIQIIGDDIFVTNIDRLRRGIEVGACNSLLWKVNQVGSLTEARDAAELAMMSGYTVMASHRSGETEDPFVADLAVGIGCGQIKSGAPARGERTAKYNQLLRIEEWLGDQSRYPKGLLR
ncbi:phosphopyruvate hydratase [Candidatus Bathyarchaeota archaeon RBG_13_60_20]|nr:MAG: phosphopyruvate hydratase [Candidatus Bathyarchaeota archaeon RBG_13_60_20]